MSLTDWLRYQAATRAAGRNFPYDRNGRITEAIATVKAAQDGTAQLRAEAVMEAAETPAEDPYAAIPAPWVRDTSRPPLPRVQTELLKTAFRRDSACPVCAYRYSGCYAFNHGGDR